MQATGLTSGAITGVVDRLEAAGFVRREPDAHDRRKVVLRADPARLAEVAGYYASLQKAMLALWSSFTQAELQMVLDFTRRSCDLSTRELEAIQALPKMARGGSKRAAGRPAAPSRRR
jgi:DNA-binding MarR family transcriptional regulator